MKNGKIRKEDGMGKDIDSARVREEMKSLVVMDGRRKKMKE